jgi:hypothetical protein
MLNLSRGAGKQELLYYMTVVLMPRKCKADFGMVYFWGKELHNKLCHM